MRIDEKELQRIGEEFATSLATIIGKNMLRSVKVEKVDNDVITASRADATFTVRPTLLGQKDKFLAVYPKVGSTAVIAYVNGDPSTPYIVACTEIDRVAIKIGEATIDVSEDTITFNGGENDGLVIVGKLTERLNKIERDINSLKTAIASWVVVPSDGGASLKGVVSSWASQRLTESKNSDYENDKIKQ